MSVDLDCGCSVGAMTGMPHYVCKRHRAIEREQNLNPIFPQEHPLPPALPGEDDELPEWVAVVPDDLANRIRAELKELGR